MNFELIGLLLSHEEFDIHAQRALIALQGEHVVSLLVEDFPGDVALAAHRIDGDDRPLDRQHLQQLGDGHDLVGLVRHVDLTEHQALAGGEGRDHVDGGLGAGLLIGAPRGLAVDRDHLGRRAGQRATQQRWLDVERGEDVAEMIVRRRPVAKRPEPAQQLQLLLAEAGDIDEGLRPSQHGEQDDSSTSSSG